MHFHIYRKQYQHKMISPVLLQILICFVFLINSTSQPIPTPLPSSKPTPRPSSKPTPRPSSIPTPKPTPRPSSIPTFKPTTPTGTPTSRPSSRPTSRPTSYPTQPFQNSNTGIPTIPCIVFIGAINGIPVYGNRCIVAPSSQVLWMYKNINDAIELDS